MAELMKKHLDFRRCKPDLFIYQVIRPISRPAEPHRLNLKAKLLNNAVELVGDIYLKVLSYYRFSLCILYPENRDCFKACKYVFLFPDSLSGLSLIHISEPTRLGMISYAVFCLKK